MNEQPILDTTPASKIKAGMWCEFDSADTDAHYCGVLEDKNLALDLDGQTILYKNGRVAGWVRNLRVYEHKPQPEYPTEEGFYRFEGTVYRLDTSSTGNLWQGVCDVKTGQMHALDSLIGPDSMMRNLYPDVTPIPYKLVPDYKLVPAEKS